MAKKRKKRIVLRYRKKDHAHNVQVSVARWIKANGGNAVMIGGIGIMHEAKYKYQVSVGIVGTPPVKAQEKKL